MKKYLRDLSIGFLVAAFFVALQHTVFFKTYEALEEMCKVIK